MKKGSYQITRMFKDKKSVVRTQANFKAMVSKPPNAEGNFEVTCELKEEAKPVEQPVVEEKKPVTVPEY